MEEIGVWAVLLSRHHPREEEVRSTWLEHQGILSETLPSRILSHNTTTAIF